MNRHYTQNSSIITKRQHGFTVVELIVVISTLSILIVMVLFTLANLYQSNINILSVTTQQSDTHLTLQAIRSNLLVSHQALANTSTIADGSGNLLSPLGANNSTQGWTYNDPAGSGTQALIVQTYATNKALTDPTRQMIVSSTLSPGGCGSTSPKFVRNTQIYFVRDETLYRRTIIGQNRCPIAGVDTVFQKQTCAAGSMSSPNCQGTDALLLRNVTGFQVNYFATVSDKTPITLTTENAEVAIQEAEAYEIVLKTTLMNSGTQNEVTARVTIEQ